jgi:nucleoid DNA-binding protein
MNELIEAVQRQAGISSEQATLAVSVMLSFLNARLSSPLVGRIQTLLENSEAHDHTDTHR